MLKYTQKKYVFKGEIKMKFSMGQLDGVRITILAEDSVQYDSVLTGQHGISYFIEAYKDNHKVNILFDVAQFPEALLHNMKMLKIDPATIDIVALSHCHSDHTQGLATVLEAIGKNNIPVVAHPSLFRLNFVTRPYLAHFGIRNNDMPTHLEEQGGKLFLVSEPLELMEGIITSGEVERQTDFEELGLNLFTIINGSIEQDKMMDDLSLIANVEGKGLVIMSGCSHAGIVNICRHAISTTGIQQIQGILGGFHLISATEEHISQVIKALKKLDPAWISAGHCTGFVAETEFKNTFENNYRHLSTGDVFTIGNVSN